MARRPSSSRSSSSRSAKGSAGGRKRTPPPVEVHCPKCGAEYRIPEAMLAKRVQCKRCGRVFVPQNLLRKSQRRSGGAAVPLGGAVTLILGLVLVVGGAVLVSNLVSEKPAPSSNQAASQSAPAEDPQQKAREEASVKVLETVARWVNALKNADEAELDILTDPAGFYRLFPDQEKPKGRNKKPLSWSAMDPIDRVGWKNRIFKALTSGDLGKPLREKEFLDGTFQVAQGDPLNSTYLEAHASFSDPKNPRAVWIYAFTLTREDSRPGSHWRVARFTLKSKPKLASKKKKKRRPGIHVPKGVKPEEVKVAEETIHREGKVKKVLVVKPIPLGHLEDTPPELRKEIDHLLEIAADPNARPREVDKACRRLVEIGRPAMPRILNLFYQIMNGPDPDSYDNRTTVFRIIKSCLVPMTRCEFGFNPTTRPDEEGNTAAQERRTALGQYYAWWFQHNDKAYWDMLKKLREKEEEESGF